MLRSRKSVYAPVGMTKVRAVASIRPECRLSELQIPRLLGMTKGRAELPSEIRMLVERSEFV
jgi:hypothetical protein